MSVAYRGSYLISMVDAEARRRTALDRCARVGLDPVVVEGSTPDQARADGLRAGPGVDGPAFGCAASHRRVLERIAEGPEGWSMVLEDDVVFVRRFAAMFDRIMAVVEPDWGMVQLGWLPAPQPTGESAILRGELDEAGWAAALARGLAAGRPFGRPSRPLLVSREPQWGTHCYLVSRRVAGRLVDSIGPLVFQPVDHHFAQYARFSRDAHFWRTRLSIAAQDPAFGSETFEEHLPWWYRARYRSRFAR